MNEIYAIDSSRISVREYWWGTKSPLLLVALLLKYLRVRIPSSTDDPNFASTRPWLVPEVPAQEAQKFQPLTAELITLGFQPVAWHCFRDPGTQTTIYWLTFQHVSGQHFARIHHRQWAQSQKVSRALFPMFFTEFADGTFFVSSAGKPDMVTPSTVLMNRLPGANLTRLWHAHQTGVVAQSSAAILPATDLEAVLAATERHHVLLRDFHLARGVFRARTNTEEVQAEAYANRLREATEGGLAYPEIMAELDRLQRHKPGWGNAIGLLLLSIIAFLAIGAARWDWKFTLWLIPVLLFHEAGHWVAMRWFGYRNLRMFFIPLFGAAVSGQHWNVPGWKKVLVSLAGPVPGIALGAIMVIIALLTKVAWLNEAAFMLLLLNGFNLLPVLPLDGGHVLQATLFCRNRWLDFGFRVAAVVLLFLLGFAGMGIFFFVLPVLLAMGLPLAFKVGKVVDELRQQSLPQPAPGDDHIPTATAEAIITALKREQPAGATSKLIAQQALGVFETLNAHPPSPLATLGLLALHAASFFGAILFMVLLVAGRMWQSDGAEDFSLLKLTRPPQHEIRCEQPARVWPPNQPNLLSPTNRSLFISTFADATAAGVLFDRLTNRLPAQAHLTCIGDSVLVTLPGRDAKLRDRWLVELFRHNTNTFLAADNANVAMAFTITLRDAQTATNLEAELKAFTALPGASLVAPWSPAAQRPEYQTQLAARQVWLRLNRELGHDWAHPEVKALNRRINRADRTGSADELAQLKRDRDTLLLNLAATNQARLQTELAGTPHVALVELHARMEDAKTRETREAVLAEAARYLGAEPDAARVSNFNFVTRHGQTLEARWCTFTDPSVSLPEFARWLCRSPEVRIRYDFTYDRDTAESP